MKPPGWNHWERVKSLVAVAAMRGEHTLAERADQFDVRPNQVTQWKLKAMEGIVSAYDKDAAVQRLIVMTQRFLRRSGC